MVFLDQKNFLEFYYYIFGFLKLIIVVYVVSDRCPCVFLKYLKDLVALLRVYCMPQVPWYKVWEMQIYLFNHYTCCLHMKKQKQQQKKCLLLV